MRVTFYGGVDGVTGSRHLLEVGKHRILLDCGMFQGHRKEVRRLNSELPFEAASITSVILSHGHLDHCGMLPVLVKSGYQGSIFATSATRDVAHWILRDAAHIQTMDAEYMNRHRIEGAELAEPTFTEEDALKAVAQIVPVPYVRQTKEWFTLAPDLRLKFYDAGHILGSAVTVLEASEMGTTLRLGFTGDLGRINTPLIPDPEAITDEVPVLLMESTYGNRVHQPVTEAVERLKGIVKRVAASGGKIIVPSFALGRTQEIIYVLHQLTDRGEIPRLPIFVDSPLALNLTDVFRHHPEEYDTEAWAEFGSRGEAPLAFSNLTYVATRDESKALNTRPGPFMVISASGMCEAGRILHHLANGLGDPKNVVLITGFQAEHTLGRRLVEGLKSVRIFGTPTRVVAAVEVLNEFSAHADGPALASYAGNVPGLRSIFLVHGEHRQAVGLQDRLLAENPNRRVTVPKVGEQFELAVTVN